MDPFRNPFAPGAGSPPMTGNLSNEAARVHTAYDLIMRNPDRLKKFKISRNLHQRPITEVSIHQFSTPKSNGLRRPSLA